MAKYRSLEHSIQALLLEKKHAPNPKEEGVFATSRKETPKFETPADEERARSDTAVRKGQESLVARPGDDRGDSVIRRQDEPRERSTHSHQFVRKIDVGEETTMKKLPTHLLEAVKKSLDEDSGLDVTGDGKTTQKDILIRRLESQQKKGNLDEKGQALLQKLMKEESPDTTNEIENAVKMLMIKHKRDHENVEEKRKKILKGPEAAIRKLGYQRMERLGPEPKER